MTLVLRIENYDKLADGGPVEFRANNRSFEIGRDPYMDWPLPDPERFISSRHCEVRYADGQYWLNDVSRNGTFVNGHSQRLKGQYQLQDGDRLQIGPYVVSVRLPRGQGVFADAGGYVAPAPQADNIWDLGGPAPPPVKPSDIVPPRAPRRRDADFEFGHVDIPPLIEPAPQRPAAPAPAYPPSQPGYPPQSPFGEPAQQGYPPAAAPYPQPPYPPQPGYPQQGGYPHPQAQPPYGAPASPGYPPHPQGYPAAPYPPQPPRPPQGPPTDFGGPAYAPPQATPPPPVSMPAPPRAAPPPFDPSREAIPARPVAAPLPPVAPMQPPPALEPRPAPVAPPAPMPSLAAARAGPQGGAAAGGAFVEALCQAAGISRDAFAGQSDADVAREIGEMLRISVEGLSLLLRARAAGKKLAKTSSRTTMEHSGNNPLKFVPSPAEALEDMLSGRRAGFMKGAEAYREAFEDLKRHEQATWSAMQTALGKVLEGMSPEDIEEKAKSGTFSNKKARAWEIYVERWESRNDKNENGILDVFLVYFSDAYAQIEKAAKAADKPKQG